MSSSALLSHAITCSAPRVSFLERLLLASAMRRSRRQLKTLDASLLSDIGVSRAQALAESARSEWDAPTTWTR